MGLFNYVKVEQELPLDATLKTLNHNWRDEEYQTKELEDNVMITYILRDNKLYEDKIGWSVSEPLRIGMEKTFQWINKQVNG